MHPIQVAELAALVSAHGGQLIESPRPLPEQPLFDYWQLSRARFRLWSKQLDRPGGLDGQIATLIDVFASEMLTRVWSAVLVAFDRSSGQLSKDCSPHTTHCPPLTAHCSPPTAHCPPLTVHRSPPTAHCSPIARNVFLGHLQARRQALSLMVDRQDLPIEDLSRVDRFRRRVERWTDLLLGTLVVRYDVGEFAFDSRRACEFGRDQLDEQASARPVDSWHFILAGLRLALVEQCAVSSEQRTVEQPAVTTEPSAVLGKPAHCTLHTAQLQAGIASAILGCFPPDAFQPDGAFRSTLAVRIYRSGLHPEAPPSQNSPNPVPRNANSLPYMHRS